MILAAAAPDSRTASRREVMAACPRTLPPQAKGPAFQRDLSVELSVTRALTPLTRIPLTGVPLTWALLLLARFLLPAALLLAGLLTGVLVLLARILILIAHSEVSLCFVPSPE
jgi:hypothetical protein